MGLSLHEAASPEAVRGGVLYFWRINQMFEGGRLAGAAGVGEAIAAHLGVIADRGATLWPRPDTAIFYQDKLALRLLFEKTGIPTPKSWVARSVIELEALLQGGKLTESDFPLLLKHPYASSSRGMVGCSSLTDVKV